VPRLLGRRDGQVRTDVYRIHYWPILQSSLLGALLVFLPFEPGCLEDSIRATLQESAEGKRQSEGSIEKEEGKE